MNPVTTTPRVARVVSYVPLLARHIAPGGLVLLPVLARARRQESAVGGRHNHPSRVTPQPPRSGNP